MAASNSCSMDRLEGGAMIRGHARKWFPQSRSVRYERGGRAAARVGRSILCNGGRLQIMVRMMIKRITVKMS